MRTLTAYRRPAFPAAHGRRRLPRLVGAAILLAGAPAVWGQVDPVPTGTVLVWIGDPAAMPPGWALCDGANGTPDLRGRYVMGTTSPAEVGATGGSDSTDPAGKHTPSVTAEGGSMALNPNLGATRFNEVDAHTHTIEPRHVPVNFAMKTQIIVGQPPIPPGMAAFWPRPFSAIPADWSLFKPDPEFNLLLMKGRSSAADKPGGGIKTADGGAHIPSITAEGGSMSLNPALGWTKFNEVAAHEHPYVPPVLGLAPLVKLPTAPPTVPPGLIIAWNGDPSALPVGWALCDGTGPTPDLNGRFVVLVTEEALVLRAEGAAETALAGEHTHSITAAGGTMSLNPNLGWTKFNPVAKHKHTAPGPPYVKLPFLVKLP